MYLPTLPTNYFEYFDILAKRVPCTRLGCEASRDLNSSWITNSSMCDVSTQRIWNNYMYCNSIFVLFCKISFYCRILLCRIVQHDYNNISIQWRRAPTQGRRSTEADTAHLSLYLTAVSVALTAWKDISCSATVDSYVASLVNGLHQSRHVGVCLY